MKVYTTLGIDTASGAGQGGQDAWAWAIKLSEYVQANRPVGEQAEILQEVTGRGNRILFVSRFASLGDAEKGREWTESDDGVQEFVREANEKELVDWSTLDRTYFRVRS